MSVSAFNADRHFEHTRGQSLDVKPTNNVHTLPALGDIA